MEHNMEQYIREIVDDQIQWHDKKAIENQKTYKRRTRIITVLSLSIPIITSTDFTIIAPFQNLIIGIIGASISYFSILLNLDKNHQNWIDYRNTCEQLKQEKQFYLFSVDKYADQENKDTIFIQTTQNILNRQNNNWTTSAKVPVINNTMN